MAALDQLEKSLEGVFIKRCSKITGKRQRSSGRVVTLDKSGAGDYNPLGGLRLVALGALG